MNGSSNDNSSPNTLKTDSIGAPVTTNEMPTYIQPSALKTDSIGAPVTTNEMPTYIQRERGDDE